jgi:hypothetical protein
MAIASLLMLGMVAAAAAQEATIDGTLAIPEGTVASEWRLLVAGDAAPLLSEDLEAGASVPDAGGAFSLRIANGRPLFLMAYYRGRLAPGTVTVVRDSFESEPPESLALAADPPREGLAVRVTTLDPDEPLGQPLTVHLYNDYGLIASGATDGVDEVIFEDLPMGRYYAWLEPEDPRAVSAPTATIDIEPGEGLQQQDWPVAPARIVTGVVTSPMGEPAENWVIAVRSGTLPSDGGSAAAYARGAQRCYWETTCDADGRFDLAGLTAGELFLDMRPPGGRRAYHTMGPIEIPADEPLDLGVIDLPEEGWQYPFDGEAIQGFEPSFNIGQREVYVVGDRMVLAAGADMTGVVSDVPTPTMDYEITLEAKRVDGGDFFCGMTFPVEEDAISLIMGGWGGGVTGLSSLDGADASENETSQWIDYADQRWYRVRVQVTEHRIQAWLDDRQIIDVDTEGRHIGVRIEVERCRPFGFATWRTTGALRDLRVRPLP